MPNIAPLPYTHQPIPPYPGNVNVDHGQSQFNNHHGGLSRHSPWEDTGGAGTSTDTPPSRVDPVQPFGHQGRSMWTSTELIGDCVVTERRIKEATPPADSRHDENRRRSAAREIQKPFLKEMAAAHAQNRDPHIEIPVCESGTVLGLKSPWHRAARLCARQTLNFKVRSYKAKREYWTSQVEIIAQKLSQQFTYSRPLDIQYLGKFLKNTLKNDRKVWKKIFL